MNTKTNSMVLVPKREASLARNLHLAGIFQKIVVSFWLLITILGGIFWMLSLYGLYLWDYVPAAESPLYFQDMTSEDVQARLSLP